MTAETFEQQVLRIAEGIFHYTQLSNAQLFARALRNEWFKEPVAVLSKGLLVRSDIPTKFSGPLFTKPEELK